MNVNDDFSIQAVVHSDELPWQTSPMPGVHRRRLDRVNGAQERVTTIVRYAPGSHFSTHVHDGGEEFLVLEGTFEDDYGQWPVGSYIRNPPESEHTPGSTDGCVIFVKLCQFQLSDRTFIHANINRLGRVEDKYRPGVLVSPLYQDDIENVRSEYWEPGTAVTISADGGTEILVIDGEFELNGERFRVGSWLRIPPLGQSRAVAGSAGTRVWVKSGHLLQYQ